MTEPTTTLPGSAPKQIVRCANCSADNLAGATLCQECDSHLYIVCRHCGRSNARTLRRCAGCDGRLGGSAWKRRVRRIFRKADPVTLIVGLIVLLVVVLLLVNHERSEVPPQTDQPNVSE
jgi:hypothetical protein